MGVYIRNIDIPEIKRGVAAIINIDDIVFFKTADDILLVPDHGDLIDRDEAADDACLIWGRNSGGDDAAQEIIEHLRQMKAVISAERSEE